MKASMSAFVLTLFVGAAHASSKVEAVPTWYDGGLIWYQDPHSLTSDQRRAIEIARRYLDQHFPGDRAHHKYGGLIEDNGPCWEVAFTEISIGTRPADAIDSDLELCVDKLKGVVVRVAHAQ
jgi:hypothetical protein